MNRRDEHGRELPPGVYVEEPAPCEPPAPTDDPGDELARLLVALGWSEATLYARAEGDPVGTLRLALDRLGLRDRNTDSPSVVLAVGALATVAALRARVAELEAERVHARRLLAEREDRILRLASDSADIDAREMLAEHMARADAAERRLATLEATPSPHTVAALLAALGEKAREAGKLGEGYVVDDPIGERYDGERDAYEDAAGMVKATLGAPSAIDRAVAEVCALSPASSRRIADLTYGIRHMASSADEKGATPRERRSLFLNIARQALACVEIEDSAPAPPTVDKPTAFDALRCPQCRAKIVKSWGTDAQPVALLTCSAGHEFEARDACDAADGGKEPG